jgi:hypothetical protein
MTGDREHQRGHAYTSDDVVEPAIELAPGRLNLTSNLTASTHPIVSGLIRRKADGAVRGNADHAVAAAARSAGVPLPSMLQRKFETSLGVELSGVRVHTGAVSDTAARAVSAKAYTLGQDIHFADRYDPASPANEHLLAHEVAHTVQQRGGSVVQHKLEVSAPSDGFELEADRAADAMVAGRTFAVSSTPVVAARDVDDDTSWNKDQDYGDVHQDAQGWDTRYGGSRTDGIQGIDYIKKHNGEKDAQGRGYAKMAPASEQKTAGVKLPTIALTSGDITAIYSAAKGQPGVKDSEIATMIARGNQHLPQMNAAFETMGIDTVQSQALFLAHQAGETGGGDAMVEKDAKGRSYAPFQGRGPLQVTNKGAYIRAIAYLATRSDQLKKEIDDKTNQKADLEKEPKPSEDQKKKLDQLKDEITKLTKQKADIDECVAAVKADVRQAANPKYAYLFSAANMHAAGGVESSGKVGETTKFDGRGPDEDWESGGNQQVDLDDPSGKTKKSYTFEEYRDLELKHGKNTSDMDSAIARGKVKQAVYAAAYKILKAKVDAAKAQAGQQPDAQQQPAKP